MLSIVKKTSYSEEAKELMDILSNGNITTVYQPIVSLINGSIIGYEALSRGPEDSILHSPDKLFETANVYNRTWDLELLCRVKAIERSSNLEPDKFLFINVDPHIFKDEKFKKGFTKEFLAKHNMSPESIIFEITEKTCVEDYKSFKAALNNYVEQGYKIAIDDTGSGYSGLKMLSETKPHYVKIDMDLVRNIHEDTFKQSLIECFVKLSEVTNMKLIAEGIETEAELSTLIKLGVYAGQGYFLSRPAGTFLDVSTSVKDFIKKRNRVKRNHSSITSLSNNIGEIVRPDETFSVSTSCETIKKYFDNNEEITGACIINNGFPVGLVMKHSLDSALATMYGVSVFSRRPISLVMDTSPLIVDYYTCVSDVSKEAMSRKADNTYDYIIVTKNNKYYGIVTIKSLLDFTTTLERNYAMQLNPLTELPGNSIIQSSINSAIDTGRKCCILYFDLDNFKVYNDTYGFENGDKILKYTAQLIKNELTSLFPYNGFLGHIGGDDFVCLLENSLENCEKLCSKIIKKFDEEILNFFNEKDRKNKYIEAVDRRGNKDLFSLTSLSIAGIYGVLSVFNDAEEIALNVAAIKKKVKKVNGSCYSIDSLD
jgi:diguanylate cyclase (GGDEF)-like protein